MNTTPISRLNCKKDELYTQEELIETLAELSGFQISEVQVAGRKTGYYKMEAII